MIAFHLFLLLILLLSGAVLAFIDPQESRKPPKELLKRNIQGFVFGAYHRFLCKSKYFCKNENMDGHILVCGGAGSGKSSSIAMPSILAWQSPIFAVDIKGELSAGTQNRTAPRKIFNPICHDTQGFDPFYLLRGSNNPAQAAHEIAAAIVPEPANLKDPFWVRAAQNLLTGFMLHYHHEGYDFVDTMTEILSKPVDLHIKYILMGTRSTASRLYISQFATLEGKTLGGIFAELSSNIIIFTADRHIMAALRKENIITPRDLEHGIDVFLSIPEDKLEQWRPLLTLITNQFLKHFERRPEKTAKPILFLLDEFPRLGKIDMIATGLTTLRSKKITICIIIQSLAQLDFLYGSALRRIILDNCAYKAILGASDAETQEYFSRLVGTESVTEQSISASYLPNETEEQGHTVNTHIIERRAILPHEFATLRGVVLLTPWGWFWTERLKPVETYSSKTYA